MISHESSAPHQEQSGPWAVETNSLAQPWIYSAALSYFNMFALKFHIQIGYLLLVTAIHRSYYLTCRLIMFVWFPEDKCMLYYIVLCVCDNIFNKWALYSQTLVLTSQTSGDRSVCVVRSRSQATEFSF
jgi:hypothetical protein